MKALLGWDNKGTLQHMTKMSYMAERADRMEGLGVSVSSHLLKGGLPAAAARVVLAVHCRMCVDCVHDTTLL